MVLNYSQSPCSPAKRAVLSVHRRHSGSRFEPFGSESGTMPCSGLKLHLQISCSLTSLESIAPWAISTRCLSGTVSGHRIWPHLSRLRTC